VVHNIKAVASRGHTLFLLKNGTVYASGNNRDGQIGDGSKKERCGFYWVMDHVQAVATGGRTSYLLAEDGTVYISGYHGYYMRANSFYGRYTLSFVKNLHGSVLTIN